MKRSIVHHSLPVFAVAAIAGSAQAFTLVNFDDLPGSTLVSTQYAGLGIASFTSSATNPNTLSVGVPGSSPPNILQSFNGQTDITMNFSVTVYSASLVGLDVGHQGLVLEAWLGAAPVDSFTVTGAGRGIGSGFADLLGVAHAGGFDRLVVHQISGPADDVYAIDDLIFDAVPSPGAAALLGLGGIMASRRRR